MKKYSILILSILVGIAAVVFAASQFFVSCSMQDGTGVTDEDPYTTFPTTPPYVDPPTSPPPGA